MNKLEVLHLNGNRFEYLSTDLHKLTNLNSFGLDWFNYLPLEDVKSPILRDKDAIFGLFFKQLQTCKSKTISVEDFPSFISQGQSTCYKIDEDCMCRAAYKGDLRMIIYFASKKPELLTTLNKKGLDPYNVALKYGKIKSFSELLNLSDNFQECKNPLKFIS